MGKFSILLVTVVLASCSKEEDIPQQGLFVIANQSGHDVTLTVFKTANRQHAPTTVVVANGSSVERQASGDFGGFSYPELFFQGDSVILSFSTGKRLVHYCTQTQQLRHTCGPAHNILDLSHYQQEPLSAIKTRYTYTLLPADYRDAL